MKQLYVLILLILNIHGSFSADLPPTAIISGGTTICQNGFGNITFTGADGVAPYTFSYSINGGTTLTTAPSTGNTFELAIVSNLPGTFTYSLVSVADSSGATQVSNGSAFVQINPVPTIPIISASGNTTFCEGGNVSLVANNLPGLTYQWNLNGNPIQNANSTNYVALATGNYTVSAINSNGCISTSLPISVTVYPKIEPVLGSGSTNTSVVNFQNQTYFTRCVSSPTAIINLVNQTLNQPQIASYTLNWGDGSPLLNLTNFSSNQNHTYSQGFYTLNISLTTIQGCTYNRNYGIFVGNSPSGSLGNPGNLSGCSPKTIIFPIIAPPDNVPGTQYIIDFGDGQSITYIHPNAPQSVSHTYNNSSCGNTPTGAGNIPNSFVATMTITNPCFPAAFTTVGPIIINSPPTPNFTILPSPGCINSIINILNTSNPGSIISQNGCVTTPSLYWTISPSTGWTASSLGNNGGNANDIDSWNYGINAPSINFNTAGTYTITLFIGNSCDIKSISKTICIEPPLVPTFTVNTNAGCIPLVVSTNNTTSTINQCNPNTNYSWTVTYAIGNCGTTSNYTYTNGTSSSSVSPSFNFTEAGTYTIRLTATNSCGSASTTQIITVKKPPTASIAAITSTCGFANITPVATVNNCSTSGITPTYAWSFPGGIPATSTTANPGTINYASPGTYPISLVVTNECGASNTATQTVTVNPTPIITNADLSQTICSGSATTLITLTSNPTATSYSWTATATTGITGFIASGTNTIPVQTLSTNQTSVGTVTYVITPKIGTCNGPIVSYLIYVNPAAQVNQPTAIPVCNGSSVTPPIFTTNNSGTGTTYSWANSNTSIGLAASGTGNIPQFTATNNTNTPISATITVTPSFSGGNATCNGVSKTFTITVNPTGQIIQPSDIVSCNGNVISVPFTTSNSGTTTYTWTNDTPSIGLAASGIGNISFPATNSTNNPVTATITVTPSYNGSPNCIGNPVTFTITINPSAQVNPLANVSICNGNILTPPNFSTSNTLGNTTYTWTNSNPIIGLPATGTGNLPSFTATNTGTTVITAMITVTPTILTASTSCIGSTKQFVISVLPNANVTALPNKVFCNGSNSTVIPFSTSNSAGTTTYSWTNDTPTIGLSASGNGIIPAFPAVNTGLTPITATIVVTPTLTSGSFTCSGLPQTFNITVNPSGQINNISNIEVCNGNTIASTVFSTNNLVGTTTYSWTNSNANIGLAASGTGTIPSFAAVNNTATSITATIIVTPTFTNSGVSCNGPIKTFTIKVNPSPTATISGSVTVCLNAQNPPITFTGSSGNAPYTFTYNINNSGNQTITTTSGNSISINAPTDVAGTFTYNLVNVQDSNATSCVNTLTQSATVTVNNLPVINAQPLSDQTICVGGNIQNPLTATFTNGTGTASYQWFSNTVNSNSGGTLIVGATNPTYTPPVFNTGGNFYYYVTISFSGNGCGSISSATAKIEVLADPTVTNQPITSQTLCQNETPTILTVNANGGTGNFNYQWHQTTTATTSGGTIVGTNSPSFTPQTNTVGTFYYYCAITQTGVGCDVNSTSSTVIINTSPTILNQPISSIVCQNGTPTTLSFTYSNGVGNPTYQWFSNATNSNIGGISITGETNPTYIPQTTTTETFYYYCVISFPSLVGSCSNVATNVASVTVNASAVIDVQPLPIQTICVGGTIQNSLTATFTNGTGTATYQWFSNIVNSNSGGTLIVGATNSTYTPPVFNLVGNFYYYVTISFSGNGCGSISSATAEIKVLADPIVSLQPIASQTLCQNETPTILSLNATGGSGNFSYQWYQTTTSTTTGGALVGTNSPSFTPQTNTVGTFYYYCAITQTGVGCAVNSNSSTVIINISPTIQDQPVSSIVCENGIPTTLSLTYLNGVGTPTYQWFSNTTNSNSGGTAISGATNSTYIPATATVGSTYYYCIINFSGLAGSCSNVSTNVASVTVNASAAIDVQPLPTQTICVGGTIQNPLTATFTNGTGTANYQWFSNTVNSNSGGTLIVGATNPTYTPPVFNLVGNFYYYVTISFSGNGCGSISSATAEINVLADPIVTSQPIASQTLCQNSNASNLTVSASGGIGTFSYQWYSNTTNNTTGGTLVVGQTNDTFTPPTNIPGTTFYYCMITQPNGIGCNATSQTATININVAPAISANPASETICLGNPTTSLNVNYSNGTGTPTYQWFSNTNNSNTGGTAITTQTNATFSPPSSPAGTFFYYCVITFPSLNGGCEIITSNAATIIINQVPVISPQLLTICSSTNFNIIPVNSLSDIVPVGTTYTWSAPAISPIGSITGSSAQTIGQLSISQTLVNNSTSAATATYIVTPTSGNCIGSNFTITITINPATNPNAVVTNATCFGINNGSISTNITGGIPFPTGVSYTILWTGPNSFTSTSPTISNLEPGVYNLSINDAGGCPISENYTITEPADIILTTDFSNNITCFGSNNGSIGISVIGGTGAYTYSWTQNNLPFAVTEDISNLSPATYIVSVSDANNCGPKTLTFVITEPPLLTVTLGNQINVDCFGSATGSITTITSGGTPISGSLPYNYSWTGPNGFTSSNPDIGTLFAGNYNLTVTDNLGCIANLSVIITQPTQIIITAVTTPIACYNDNNATITATVSGGTPPYLIQWSNLATGLNLTDLAPGNYTIAITDSLGCQKSLVINIPAPPIFDVSPVVTNISCFGAHDGSIVLNFVGGIAPVNLVWSDGNPAGTTRNNLGPGTYSVTITDSKPCTIFRTFTILEPQPLVLSANITNALDCNNANSGAINLLVSGGTPPFTYIWNNGITSEDLSNIPAGNYQVTVTDSRGCSKLAQYSITRPSPIVLSVTTATTANCANHSVTQNFSAIVSGGVPPFQFNWSSGTVSGSNNEFMTTPQNGLVTLTATDAIGCSALYSLNVDIPTLGNPTFTPTSIGYISYGIYSINDPIQFQSVITGDYISLVWDFGDGTFSNDLNPIHTYLIPNEYYLVKLTVTYPFGCVYVNQLALNVEKGYILVVPTAFTPNNNDGINDTLRPVTKGLKNIHLDVYDTWGSLIYSEVGDVIVGWNGKIKNIDSENGNYYVKVSAETFYGTIINENRTFVLIK